MKPEEVKIYFYRSRGPGGQRKNRKETAVKILHVPTGVTARATEHRFQHQNRQLAMERLEEKLRVLREPQKKRIATRKPRYAREKELTAKKKRSEKKWMRRNVINGYGNGDA
ncbi:MAG: peptide chain release factor-like protein [Candidatus Omnitrophica bacterium]|nr:peptide chain release factor-like protein [Candidatus Omnitrophota bacterium]